MSVGKPHLDDNVRRKRQRTASQDGVERRPAKKARSGPHHHFSRETINLNATSLPRKSTTRRAATDVGHNTKQDRLDYQRTSEGRHSLPHSPLPYANSPQRLPLTEESLRLLNNCYGPSGLQHSELSTSYASLGTSPSEKAIIAYNLEYTRALEERRVFFAAEFDDERAPGLDELWTALLAPRESPEPSEGSIEELRRDIDDATTERATRDAILPKVIPLKALILSDTATSVPATEWKSVLDTELKPSLTAPKPDRTIGWESSPFRQDFPKACASLETFMLPVIGARCLAWPLFTIESRGEEGSPRLARLRNLHNGAVMLSNLYALKQKCRREETFDKVHAMGVEIFDSCVQLSCYWATRSESGEIKYLGTKLQTWTLLNKGDHGYKEARLCIHNAINRVRSEAQEWIRSDLQSIEDMLVSVPLSQVTPPKFRSVRSCVSSGRFSKASTSTDNSGY